ncbi:MULTISPECIES: serpin family protein [unclassified Kitasatospora]|uniref:serpin family protein n=1 Tax=unclassified Kitasatospora TaxID=2633591 RepID=UPI00070EA7CF|nr:MULTISPECIES: serpin family protein [unclassified Kitasatospora]KQV19274.1 hypothetical protein ASC99_24325 [Kitasatospora sp. Root107]KRB77549.1 hypothetical protein ASE03_00525 [Kitasatospora sp. Root187]
MNSLTARWARGTAAREGTVLTAVGVWPLLAFLATGADQVVRRELEEAVGASAEQAVGPARDLLATLDRLPETGAALSVWTAADLLLEPGWVAGLPPGTHGLLTGDPVSDAARLDGWADRSTGGMIRRMPLTPRPDTRLVLAGALTVRTRWLHPFRSAWVCPESGPWIHQELAGLALAVPLEQLPDALSLAETSVGPVTELRLPGTGDIDVHLLLGPERADLGDVLTVGLDLLAGRHRRIPAAALPDGTPGPGLRIRQQLDTRPADRLSVTTVPFSLGAEHDLLATAPLFGLDAATGRSAHGFTGISPAELLIVSEARQTATATFGAAGFEAGAVTAVGMTRGSGGSVAQHRVRHVQVDFDRPFAFLAVHRPSGLALAAGWHTVPEPYLGTEDDD